MPCRCHPLGKPRWLPRAVGHQLGNPVPALTAGAQAVVEQSGPLAAAPSAAPSAQAAKSGASAAQLTGWLTLAVGALSLLAV